MCKFVAKLSIFSQPAKKNSIFLSKIYIIYHKTTIICIDLRCKGKKSHYPKASCYYAETVKDVGGLPPIVSAATARSLPVHQPAGHSMPLSGSATKS